MSRPALLCKLQGSFGGMTSWVVPADTQTSFLLGSQEAPSARKAASPCLKSTGWPTVHRDLPGGSRRAVPAFTNAEVKLGCGTTPS